MERRLISALVGLTVAVATYFLFDSTADATCDKTTGSIVDYTPGATQVRNDGTPGDSCQDIPDAYQITFSKIGVCTANPSPTAAIGGSPDYASCKFIYDGTPLVHEINFPNAQPLLIPPFTIPPNTYPFFVLTFSSELGIKNTITFDQNVTARPGSTGPTCWTSGGRTSYNNESVTTIHGQTLAGNTPTMDCGLESAASPVFNTEVFPLFGGDTDCATDFMSDARFSNGSVSEAGIGGGTFAARLLKTGGQYADRCTNSAQILWVITFPTPKVVSPTSTYQLAFKLTDSVSIDFDSGTGNIIKVGNDPIQAIFTVTD
jgi:hypothetical protein